MAYLMDDEELDRILAGINPAQEAAVHPPTIPQRTVRTIPASLPAQGHLSHAGAPGLILVCLVSLAGLVSWFGSAVKVLTRRGIDEDNTAAASSCLYLPPIAGMADLFDLSVPAEWLARGVGNVRVSAADGTMVRVIDTFQPASAYPDSFFSPYDRTDPFSRSHGNQCGSPDSGCPVATNVSRAWTEQLHASAGVHVLLQPSRQPEVEAIGKSQGRSYAVLQPCLDYEVQLVGTEAAAWAVGEVMLLWSAAGSASESDKRRIKRWRL